MLSLMYRYAYNGAMACSRRVTECNGAELEAAIVSMLCDFDSGSGWELVHTKERVYRVFRNDVVAGYVFVSYVSEWKGV